MKRVSLLIAFLAFVATSTFAQGFYVQPGVTYHIGSNKDIVGVHVKNIGEDNQTSAVLYESYGEGFAGNLELGYFFNKHVAASLGFSYVLGSEGTVEDYEFNSQNKRDYSVAQNRRMTVSPGITIDAGLEGKLSPYARIGLLMPLAGKTDGTRKSTSCENIIGAACGILFPNFEEFEATSVTKGKFTAGVEATLGLRYEVNDMVSVFGAVSFNSLHIKRNTYEVTGATVTNTDGTQEDVLPLLTLAGQNQYTEYYTEIDAQKLADYQTEVGDNYGRTADTPAWELSENANFSTIGINIGARFTFGGGDE